MTDKLSTQDVKALVEYRLERARKSLAEARYIAEGDFINTAMTRLYYGCYYAASALMIANGLQAQTHSGIKSMLGLKFISRGLLPVSCGQTYQKLFDCRQSGDYEDFVYYDELTFNQYIPKAEDFINSVESLIRVTMI